MMRLMRPYAYLSYAPKTNQADAKYTLYYTIAVPENMELVNTSQTASGGTSEVTFEINTNNGFGANEHHLEVTIDAPTDPPFKFADNHAFKLTTVIDGGSDVRTIIRAKDADVGGG